MVKAPKNMQSNQPLSSAAPILHRSLGSPYAEKVMLALGYLGAPWYSVVAPKGVPRPIQNELVAGYSRRIPILQIGADIYCDTNLILAELGQRAGRPEMELLNSSAEAQELDEFIETYGFVTMVGALSKWELITAYFRNLPVKDAVEFLKDRRKLAKKNPLPKQNLKLNREKARRYLEKINQRLLKSPYLFSNKAPTYLDFSLYTMIWYHAEINGLSLAKDLTGIQTWFSQMKNIGYSDYSELDPKEALLLAQQSDPQILQIPEKQAETEVTIKSTDNLSRITPSISGCLIHEDSRKYIIRRESSEVGVVHVHFPKNRFEII